MAKVKLNLKNLSVPQKVQFAKQIVTAMTSNSNFASPMPALASITAANKELEDAFNAAKASQDTAKAKTGIQNDKEAAFNQLFSELGNYVEIATKGDTTKIKSSGMDVRSDAAPIGDLPQTLNLAVTEGDKEGEIDLQWDRVKGSKSYVIEKSTDPITADSWKQAGIATKSSHTVQGLASGTKCWFRVAAIGTAGQGPWSDPAVKVVP